MIEKTLHAGNIAAAFAVVATATDLSLFGGAGSVIGAALSGTALLKGLDKSAKDAARDIAKEMKAALAASHVSENDRPILRQMMEAYLPSEADFTSANMKPEAVAVILADRIAKTSTDPAQKNAAILDKFKQVITASLAPSLKRALGNPQVHGAMSQELVDLARKTDPYEKLREAGITESVILRQADKIGLETDDLGKAWDAIQEFMVLALRVQTQDPVKSNDEHFVDEILARVAAFAKDGDYRAAGAEIDDALAQAEAQTARLLDQGVDVALLDRDTAKAARLLVRKADVDAGGMATFEDLGGLQDSYHVRGLENGNNLDSALAIDLAKLVLSRANGPDERGAAGDVLGVALKTLGEQDTSSDRLEKSIGAFKKSLEDRTRDRVPLEWAITQMNLATALQILGKREARTDRLEESVIAFRAALEELKRDKVPHDWAIAQNNLGITLQILGNRENSTCRLQQAVEAYRSALEELTQTKVPLDWAGAQMNLGNTFRLLGLRESGTDRLEQAVIAFKATQKVWTREKVPFRWALSQSSLAELEVAFFSKTADTAYLDRAVDFATKAREVYVAAEADHYINLVTERIAAIKGLRERCS